MSTNAPTYEEVTEALAHARKTVARQHAELRDLRTKVAAL